MLVFVIKICVCVNLKGFIAINSKFQNVYQNILLIWIKNRRLTKLTEVQMEPTSSNRWHLWRKGDTSEGKTLKFMYVLHQNMLKYSKITSLWTMIFCWSIWKSYMVNGFNEPTNKCRTKIINQFAKMRSWNEIKWFNGAVILALSRHDMKWHIF